MNAIRPAHSKRPDPSEPWRYSCTVCGTVQLEYYGPSRGQHGDGKDAHVYCRGCNDRHTRVVDKANGLTIPVTDV